MQGLDGFTGPSGIVIRAYQGVLLHLGQVELCKVRKWLFEVDELRIEALQETLRIEAKTTQGPDTGKGRAARFVGKLFRAALECGAVLPVIGPKVGAARPMT